MFHFTVMGRYFPETNKDRVVRGAHRRRIPIKGCWDANAVMVFVYQLGACVAYILVFCDQATLIKYTSQEAKANGNDSAFCASLISGAPKFSSSAPFDVPPHVQRHQGAGKDFSNHCCSRYYVYHRYLVCVQTSATLVVGL